jgi:hypothetical protein
MKNEKVLKYCQNQGKHAILERDLPLVTDLQMFNKATVMFKLIVPVTAEFI